MFRRFLTLSIVALLSSESVYASCLRWDDGMLIRRFCRSFGDRCDASSDFGANIFNLSSWSPSTTRFPSHLVATCVGAVYPVDSGGQLLGAVDPLSQRCCQVSGSSGPYSVARLPSDCSCFPTKCLAQWNIAAAATTAIYLDQALNMTGQHLGSGNPTFANVPAPSAASGSTSPTTSAATAEVSAGSPGSTFDPVSGLNPASVNLFNAVHQVYQQMLSR